MKTYKKVYDLSTGRSCALNCPFMVADASRSTPEEEKITVSCSKYDERLHCVGEDGRFYRAHSCTISSVEWLFKFNEGD